MGQTELRHTPFTIPPPKTRGNTQRNSAARKQNVGEYKACFTTRLENGEEGDTDNPKVFNKNNSAGTQKQNTLKDALLAITFGRIIKLPLLNIPYVILSIKLSVILKGYFLRYDL